VVIAAPLWVERVALRGARTPVVHTGMGPRRSARSARRRSDTAVLVAGVGGGLSPLVRVGDLVVASEVRGPDGAIVGCPSAAALAAELRQTGARVHCGPIGSWPRLARGPELRRLAVTGMLAVDMESFWLAPALGAPFAVVRAISDTVTQRLFRPAIIGNGLAALRALRHAVPALDRWAASAVDAYPANSPFGAAVRSSLARSLRCSGSRNPAEPSSAERCSPEGVS
jgi:4-hydroxy-3-methylbut-2-enyl diphosphate reductase